MYIVCEVFCFGMFEIRDTFLKGKTNDSVSADVPFVVVFVPHLYLVEFFDICDMYCVLLLSNCFYFT